MLYSDCSNRIRGQEEVNWYLLFSRGGGGGGEIFLTNLFNLDLFWEKRFFRIVITFPWSGKNTLFLRFNQQASEKLNFVWKCEFSLQPYCTFFYFFFTELNFSIALFLRRKMTSKSYWPGNWFKNEKWFFFKNILDLYSPPLVPSNDRLSGSPPAGL